MRRLILCAMVVLGCGVSYAQGKTGTNFEHLKCYGPMLGTWRYEGPSLEDVPDAAKKGTECVFQVSWRWILNKSAVEEVFTLEFEGGKKFSWKGLVGWNAAQKKIVYGGMSSDGGHELGTVMFDEATQTLTLHGRGVDGNGQETSFKGAMAKTGKNTVTWQALERTGGDVEGPSPIVTFKRVKPDKVKEKPAASKSDREKVTANLYLEFWKKYFQGEWDTEIVAGENSGREKTGTKGTWSCQLSPTKNCMIFSATTSGKPDYSAVAGYDPKS